MKLKVVTNNPLVKENYENISFVDGTFEDVLIRVRDLVYEGTDLISHPLGSSIRMFYSPYRSIIVGEKKDINPTHVEMIENSLISYRKNLKNRKIDWANTEDYASIDQALLQSTFRELSFSLNKFV